jgi:hypothetical protein
MESIDTRILFPSETACVKPPAKQCRGSALHLDGTGRKASGGIHSGRKPLQGHGRGLLRDHLATLDDRGCGESPSPVSCDGKKPSASLPHACVPEPAIIRRGSAGKTPPAAVCNTRCPPPVCTDDGRISGRSTGPAETLPHLGWLVQTRV